jgi:hypothetical protein
MSRYQQVKDISGFVKDTETGAIINTDVIELQAYKRKKQAAVALRSEIDTLKDDVKEIKMMLSQLLNKYNNRINKGITHGSIVSKR